MFRRMTIRTDPPGALVLVNGREIGYSPAAMDFTYYGTYEVTLIKDGYETETVLQRVNPPWYQYPGIDFFADNLSPVKITNRHEFAYPLRPQNIAAEPTDHLLDRAKSLRGEAQVGQ